MTPPLCPPAEPVDERTSLHRRAAFAMVHGPEKAARIIGAIPGDPASRPTDSAREQWVLDNLPPDERARRAEGEI